MTSNVHDATLQKYLTRMRERSATRPLSARAVEIMQERNIKPMQSVPWVIQLRVVGTADTLNLRVSEEETIIGRTSSGDAFPPDIDLTPYQAFELGVSRQHLAITASKNYLMICDLNSANGTFLNGMRMPAGQKFPVQNGDEIGLGDLRLQVRLHVMSNLTESTGNPIGAGKHILVIEDDMDVAFAYRMMLEFHGFQVSVTDDPAEILLFLSQITPAAVICDLFLSDASVDMDIVHLLRQQLPAKVPMLVVSGMTGGHQRQRALDAGADLFLGKPIHIDELVLRVNELIVQQGA